MGAYFTVESSSTPYRLTFGILQDCLIRALNAKLNNGEFTERGLARLTGISQPQVHNLLKGARKLSPESADIFLEALHLSVLDLLTPAHMTAWQSNSSPMEPSTQPVAESSCSRVLHAVTSRARILPSEKSYPQSARAL